MRLNKYFQFSSLQFLIVASTLFTISGQLKAAEVSVVLGSPNTRLGFVQDIFEKRSDLTPVPEFELTTQVFSILHRKQVRTASSVGIVWENGASTLDLLRAGLDQGARDSQIVITSVGPIPDSICEHVAQYSDVAFVFSLGSSGIERRSREYPNCLSSNILFIAGLNARDLALSDRSNYGDLVRLAVSAANIPVIRANGMAAYGSGTSFSTAIVAARLARIVETNSGLSGAEIIQALLDSTETRRMPSLVGKTQNALGLIDR